MNQCQGESDQQAAAFDSDYVRSQFPGLENGWAYFDNAGGTLPTLRAIEHVTDYMRRWPVQLGATYDVSAEASRRLDHATRGVSALLTRGRGDIDPRQVVFGSSTTALLAGLAQSMSSLLTFGDAVVVTDTDHEANITPWRRLSERGVEVRCWQLNQDTLRLEPDDLQPLLDERTRLVCFTHASNVLGTISPVEQITAMAHAHGARVCVDGVAYAPHRALDVVGWDVDYYVFSLYKVFGPHSAVLYGKHSCLLDLDNINHDFFTREDLPWKLQPGAFPYELAYGSLGAVEYLAELGQRCEGAGADYGALPAAYDAIADYEAGLVAPMLDFLRGRPGVRIYGVEHAGKESRLPTASFTIAGRRSSEIPPLVDPHRIGIRWGDFYARQLIETLGLGPQDGVVRISMAHYNTREEVERLIAVLDRIL